MLNLPRFHDRKTLMIISILGIGIISIAYASGTVITDTSITTPNLTVTGTCTGCGGAEASYSTYTLLYNTTFGSTAAQPTMELLTDTASAITSDTTNSYIISPTGTLLFTLTDNNNYPGVVCCMVQSETGKYQFMMATNTGTLTLYNNQVLLKTISSLKGCTGFGPIGGTIAISPDAHYISAICASTSSSLRVMTWQGS